MPEKDVCLLWGELNRDIIFYQMFECAYISKKVKYILDGNNYLGRKVLDGIILKSKMRKIENP